MTAKRRYGTIFMDILARKDLIASAKLIYIVLVHRIRDKIDCWPGTRTLSKDIGMSRGAVQRGIESLENAGLIIIDRRVRGSTNHYRLAGVAPKQDQSSGSETTPPLPQNESIRCPETEPLLAPEQSHNNLASPNNLKNNHDEPDVSADGRRASQADALVKFYAEVIARYRDKSYGRARKHVAKLLSNGQTYGVLSVCITNYAEDIALEKTEPRYRKAAGNFFGRDEEYKAYLPGTWKPPEARSGYKTVDQILAEADNA